MLAIRPKSEELVRLMEPGHTYLVGEGLTERSAPSLSSVLKNAGFGSDYSGVPSEVLDFAARRGTLVHAAIEWYLQAGEMGEFLDEAERSDPFLLLHARPYIESFLGWTETTELAPAMYEVPAYHPYEKYACTADYLGLVNGDPWALDWKTTSKISPAVALQTAGQVMPFDWGIPEGEVRRGALHIPKNGNARIVEFRDWESDRDTVIAAAHCWNVKARYK